MQSPRADKVAKNATVSSLCKVIDIVLNFVVRTLFIQFLSEEYLGVNGLFSNILTLLSFAELGIGNAITYSLYKPLADNDQNKIKSIMRLFKIAYRSIAIIVTIVGVLLIPALNWLIPADQIPNIQENIIVIYMFFLFNTAISYLFTYKQTLIIADQKQYVTSIYSEITSILSAIIRCLVLVFTRNYLLYLALQSIMLLIGNYVLAARVDKEYPLLKEKDAEVLEKAEINEITNNVKAMFVFKIGNVIFSGTDNIIIAKLINVVTVGLTSQYTLIINSISSVVGQLLGAFTASIGNVNAVETKEKKETVFYQVMFLCFWIYGFVCGGIYTCINDLIVVWIGEEYLVDNFVVLSLALVLFFDGLSFVTYTYRVTFGLFRKAVYIPMLSSVLNIILSIVLGKAIGLAGIYLATAISRLLSTNLIDSYLVTKYCFGKTPIKYHLLYMGYSLFVFADTALCGFALSFLPLQGIMGFILKVILFSLMYELIFVLLSLKNKNFRYVLCKVVKIFRNKIGK